ncbi:hypothetical protein Tsubulata_025618 [Turnera subulata]|uniref:Exostosin GT47 domain-containing protein n=1 Tax=Turnera subulata TaxID=218843 RepID=A0A9Q0FK43_9ROSI|nr:hypothetical protein Tsubulata_025618 [Turnera subulata]
MGDCIRKLGVAACGFSSTAWMKLLLVMVPLMVVAGFVGVFGPKACSWDSVSTHPWLWGYGGHTSGSLNATVTTMMPVSDAQAAVDDQPQPLDLHSRSAVVVGVQNNSDDEESSYSLIYLNSSAPDPQPEATQVVIPTLESNVSKEEEVHILPPTSTNKTLDLEMKTGGPAVYTKLGRLEARLQKVRASIREAVNGNQTQEDLDYVPIGPMYRNARVFHRSYLEMERQFKVFVYEEGEPPVFHNGPCKSIYSMEGNFIHRIEIDEGFRTRDPEKAHVFFLPFSVAKMVQFVYVRDSHDFGPIRRTITDYVNLVAAKYPHWNRSLGADHFMLACHDWGPEASFSVPELGKNSIRALCNANTSERFNPLKDVSFPEINLQTGSIQGLIGGPSPSGRPILAFFAGGLHGPIRPIVLEHWENKDDDIQVHRYLPKGVSYYGMLRKSKFCLCPSGYEVASPRVAEAFYTGCVPVLISDHYVPPFSDVLNWKSFSVEVSVKDIPNLKRILTSISPRQYIRMQRRVVQIRKHFEVHSPPKRFDVFHMILHSIWLRRLNVRIGN